MLPVGQAPARPYSDPFVHRSSEVREDIGAVALVIEERSVIRIEDAAEPRGHLCEPRITRLRDGAILLSFRTGRRRSSPDGSPRLLRSHDEGRTWVDLGRPFDALLPADPGWDHRATSLVELPSGSLLACLVGLDRSSPDRPEELVYNPDPAAYQGMIPIRNLLSRSEDGGRSWSSTWRLEGQTVPNSAVQCLVGLLDGDVLAALETFKRFDEPGPWRYRVDVIRSHDEGVTWGETAAAHMSDPEGDPRHLMAWDPRMARLPGGRLVQLYYTFLNGTGGEGPVHAGWSDDGGRTWALPRPTGLIGQATFPIALSEGRLLGFCQRRDASQSMVAVLSTDGGQTFDTASELVVYEHDRPSAGGHRAGADAATYMNDMTYFTFGHPCGVPLGPDRALLVWYAGDETRTAIHGATIRLA